MESLKINERFQALIPPLASEELAQLEKNLIADGCRDPLVTWRGILIDGHNRYPICKRHGIRFKTVAMEFADEDAACIWIIRNQFGRRNITLAARCRLAESLAEALEKKAKENQRQSMGRGRKGSSKLTDLNPIDSREQACKEAGVSTGTLSTYKKVKERADPETMHKLETDPNAKLHRIAKDIKETKAKEERKEKRMEAAKDAPAVDDRIIVGDFRKHSDKVADGSLSLIFTDPPYDREASKMLDALAEFAEAKLADGGSLICYVGQTQLPTAMDAFRSHLRYWWTIACVHAGRSTVMREYGVNAGWKAVLWFVKKTRDDNSIMVSDVMSGGEEKTHHDWQQSESEAAYWIEKLCPLDGTVCDPFLGSGTTAAAAQHLGRKWIAFEIDKDAAAIARKRVK